MLEPSSKLVLDKISRLLDLNHKAINSTSLMKSHGLILLLSQSTPLDNRQFLTLKNFLISFKRINQDGFNTLKRMIHKIIQFLILPKE